MGRALLRLVGIMSLAVTVFGVLLSGNSAPRTCLDQQTAVNPKNVDQQRDDTRAVAAPIVCVNEFLNRNTGSIVALFTTAPAPVAWLQWRQTQPATLLTVRPHRVVSGRRRATATDASRSRFVSGRRRGARRRADVSARKIAIVDPHERLGPPNRREFAA
jgi:hypothetical protein